MRHVREERRRGRGRGSGSTPTQPRATTPPQVKTRMVETRGAVLGSPDGGGFRPWRRGLAELDLELTVRQNRVLIEGLHELRSRLDREGYG